MYEVQEFDPACSGWRPGRRFDLLRNAKAHASWRRAHGLLSRILTEDRRIVPGTERFMD